MKGREFVKRLLTMEPENRMTMQQALAHPWLAGHQPTYRVPTDEEGRTATVTGPVSSDLEMEDGTQEALAGWLGEDQDLQGTHKVG